MSTKSPDDDTWLETEVDAEQATGPAAAALLTSVATALDEAPDDRRYDVELVVDERDSKKEELSEQ